MSRNGFLLTHTKKNYQKRTLHKFSINFLEFFHNFLIFISWKKIKVKKGSRKLCNAQLKGEREEGGKITEMECRC